MHVGKLLKKIDELGIAINTIVFYSTDNGPHYNTWPDAASTPFRGEKNTNFSTFPMMAILQLCVMQTGS